MVRNNKNNKTSGHTGNIIFQYQKGKQTVRSMPSHYNDKRSDAQMAQRERFARVMELYKQLKPVLNGCFESERLDKRTYDLFKSYNLAASHVVSGGSLPALDSHLIDGCLQCEIRPADWRCGDRLLFIRLCHGEASSEEYTLPQPLPTVMRSAPLESGLYAWIHIREERNGRRVSTQQLIEVP